jgi:hypothetical protein
MEETIYTLQEFMLHTETNTYILVGVYLLAIVGFWLFLTARDEE